MIGRRTFVLVSAVLVSCSQSPESARSGGGLASISQFASWSYELRAPECASPESCLADVDKCGGTEANAPNTINDSCPETSSCSQSDSYVEQLWVEPVSGTTLVRGGTVRAGVSVWNGSTSGSAVVDIYRAADATNPSWIYVATLTNASYGFQNLTTTFLLPAGTRQAIRAAVRAWNQTSASPCPASGAGDRDDLVFSVDAGDTTPPTVALTAPADGAQVSGTVTLVADAQDAYGASMTGVAKVQFYAGATLLGTDITAPYSLDWDARAFPPGTYTLTARATDGAGNVGVSAPLAITIVADTVPPAVSVDAPASPLAGVVHLVGFASDAIAVSRVEFYAGDTLLGYDDATPVYETWWDTTAWPNGDYAITARAVDPSGNVGTSPPVTVTIDNPPGTASFDAANLRVPTCSIVGARCDSANHLAGKSATERNTPNTIRATCADGTSGPEAIEAFRVESEDGGPLAEGAVAVVTVDVTTGTSIAPRYVDLFAAGDATAPTWRYVTTLSGVGSGTLVGRYTLGAGPFQALRVHYASVSRTAPCYTPPYDDDTDDLAFAVAPGAPDTAAPYAAVTAPANGAQLQGAFTIQADAWDDRLLSTVELLVDGAPRAVLYAPPFQAALDTSWFSKGYHAIAARARDGAGNVTVSAPVTVWLGAPDVTPPTVSITGPGSYVGFGSVLLSAAASDDVAVARVEFYVDGALVATDTTAPYQAVWDSSLAAAGNHTLTARAYDSSGNTTLSGWRGVYLAPYAAAYDPALRAPRCGLSSRCDTFDLVTGRGPLGPEPWTPSTIGGSCADGAAGTFHVNPSIDEIMVSSTSGGTLQHGVTVEVDVKVFTAYYSAESLDLYYAADATHPSWTWLATVSPTQAGAQWLTARYVLPVGNLQAVRARYRSGGAAGPCGTGAYDDVDDLGFAVATAPPDTAPPTVALTSPAAGAQVSGAVSLAATATDDRAVARVEFLVDGAVIATDTTAPYAVTWSAGTTPGSHVLAARASDAAGNSATSAPVTVAVVAAAGAAYDSSLRTVSCAAVGSRCDSGTLFAGRAGLGPEANAPNTIGATCADGAYGTYHSDESVEAVQVATLDAAPFAAGKTVAVTVKVWAYAGYTSDKLDIYTAPTVTNPTWTLLTTLTPVGSGLQTLTAQYVLPAGTRQAVRAQFRYGGTASPCTSGSYNDRDDLVFAVAP